MRHRHFNARYLGHHPVLLKRGGLIFKITGNAVLKVFGLADINNLALIVKHFVNAGARGQVF